MEEESNSVVMSEQFLLKSRLDSKMIREKRTSTRSGEKHDLARKRVKIRDLQSVIESEETTTDYPECRKENEYSVQLSFGEKDMSHVTEVPVTLDLDASQARKNGRDKFSVEVTPAPTSLDLNIEACSAKYSSSDKSSECPEKVPLSGKHGKERHGSCGNSKGIDVDLNVEDVTSSVNPDLAHSHKDHGHIKSRDVSESGSCAGPLEEKDPMKIWKEMKQNGFLSSSHGGIPMPKQRGRKGKIDVFKKRMELAKREQVNRFTKIAAPSGLLNELNPGIINHVRNRKQVHSIIEALVSEKHESGDNGSKPVSHPASGSTEGSKKGLESMTDARKHLLTFSDEGDLHNSLPSRQTKSHPATLNDSSPWILEDKVGNSDTSMLERADVRSCPSQSTNGREDDILALKLTHSVKAPENSSSSNEDSSNLTSVSSLSLKAASVASQWLELLHQDIKGRLSALRRSRRRVRAVITTELPFLIAKEFSNNQENDPYVIKVSAGLPSSKNADMHRARWTALFNQMDDALSEEEKQLESWLNQVKEKQLLCDQGLQHINWNAAYGLQPLGASENESRVWIADRSEKQLAVNAAAASIYSTCNFLLSQS
ncbi:hypothetical protein L6164_029822 [Bauhinia variegata]|uniref:Uncharacterized protein n=1 Tax=Bauhinia variegata TaxID=167791 RepID=A0ACB9LBR8_BAUVA|nr:hypothetical protein L6164_029822 [Bauhinia variegata]